MMHSWRKFRIGKNKIIKRKQEPSLTEQIVKALERTEDLLRGAPQQGESKRGRQAKQPSDVDLQNVVKSRRNRDKALKRKDRDSSSTVRKVRSDNVIRVKPLLDQKNVKLKVKNQKEKRGSRLLPLIFPRRLVTPIDAFLRKLSI